MSSSQPLRQRPNVLISGTPGTGKTLLCQAISARLADMKIIDVSEFCKTNDCIDTHDDQLDTDVIDDQLLEEKISPVLESGGYLIDYHSPDLFPTELIDVVYILRCNNTQLYDRLQERQYSEAKITGNIECEIFETIVEEAVDWFGEDCVHQLVNETEEQLATNCDTVCQWIENYRQK
ncbi:adenylate kinase isoenzyme 6 homolog [Oppia nitens]|uniref:adenylate kinase isoenzyme 6 homolog n=1 Tax=Oppia nitens TaxID=1686743 RepID=UPI0023DC369B|nr:adenylate kinase isoenzyme 6 homolog [Oppia nitens]